MSREGRGEEVKKVENGEKRRKLVKDEEIGELGEKGERGYRKGKKRECQLMSEEIRQTGVGCDGDLGRK